MSNSKKAKYVSIERQTEVIRAELKVIAESTCKTAQGALEGEAKKILNAARMFAPRKTGFLESEDNWEIQKKYDSSLHGRRYFNIRLKENKQVPNRVHKDGTPVKLKDYARLMEYGIVRGQPYNLGEGSEGKQSEVSLNGESATIGYLFFTRAVNRFRGSSGAIVARAVKAQLAKRNKK